MDMTAPESRQDEIRTLHREYRSFYQLLGGMLLIILGVWLGSVLYASDTGYSTNLYTEVLSIAITAFIIDRLNAQRELRRERNRLVFQMGSHVNSIALEAARVLKARGWHDHTWLNGADFQRANLSRAMLDGFLISKANFFQSKLDFSSMTGVKLNEARLTGADLSDSDMTLSQLNDTEFTGSNLMRTSLAHSDLKRSDFRFARLTYANLYQSDLGGANLSRADLSHADLSSCNLAGCNLRDVVFNPETTLPDGTSWNPDEDLTRFTDSDHPNFWRPESTTIWWNKSG